MANAICRADAPILLQHAEGDTLCPVETSKSLYAEGKKARSDIVLIVYPSIPGIEGHAQFNFENRKIWASLERSQK